MSRTLEFDQQQVLEKAMDLFWEKGYSATSAQDIVTKLGINRSSLYNTFGDKYQLFMSALRFYQEKNKVAMTSLTEQTEDPKATLQDIFKALVSSGPHDPLSKGCFVVNTAVELAPHDPEIQKVVKFNMEFSEQIFLSLLQKAQSKGQLAGSTDIVALSRFLANSVNGLRVAARADLDKATLEDIINVTLSAIV